MLLFIYLFVISNFWIFINGQINSNQTESVKTCKCMKYWSCIENSGIVYSTCGLFDICCLFDKTINKEELDFFNLTSRFVKKKLSTNTIQRPPKKKIKKVLRSNDFDDILNNQLTNQSRPSRRKPLINNNQTNSFFCGRIGEKGELYHWHADILDKRQNLYICGSSLISDQFVLTSAHCFINSKNSSVLKVRLGDYDLSRNDESILPYQEVSVKRIIIHPKFSPITLENDIALLHLSKSVKTNAIIEKICLPSNEDLKFIESNLEKLKCFITGHGKLNESSKNYSLTLKQISVPIWNMKKCESALRRLFIGSKLPSMNSILCAGSLNQDACIGDGGSALSCTINNSKFMTQIGLVSFGIGCGRSGVPGVYTSLLGDKINFIRKNIK